MADQLSALAFFRILHTIRKFSEIIINPSFVLYRIIEATQFVYGSGTANPAFVYSLTLKCISKLSMAK